MDDLVLGVGVVHGLLARGAPPARLERGAAHGVPQRLAAACLQRVEQLVDGSQRPAVDAHEQIVDDAADDDVVHV